MIGRSCDQLEIDTKGICLLCLGSTVDTNGYDDITNLPSLQGLKSLLRYLKVSPKDLFNCSTEFLQSMEIREDIDLKISLCSKCSSVTHKFNKLYQEYELIQLQFGNCVQYLYQSIRKGNESPERVRKYKDQMRPTKSTNLVNASIAANLRNETLKKCFAKLQSVTPRVKVVAQNMERCAQLPEKSGIGSSSASTGNKTQSSELGDNLVQLAQSVQNTIESQSNGNTERFECLVNDARIDNAENRIATDQNPDLIPKIESCFILDGLETFLQTTADPTSDLSKLRSAMPKVKLADQNANVEKYSKLPETGGIESNSASTSSKTQSLQNTIDSQFHPPKERFQFLNDAEYIARTDVPEIESFLTHHPEMFIQISAEETSDIKVVNEVKSAKATGRQKRSYFTSIRRKLKKKSKPTATTAHSTITLKSVKDHLHSTKTCEYCKTQFSSPQSLKTHVSIVHSERIISKFLPANIALEHCKQSVQVVCEHMFQISDNECQFCNKKLSSSRKLKRHLIAGHAEQFAVKVFENIQSFPEYNYLTLEDMPTPADTRSTGLACEYCDSKFSSRASIYHHKGYKHPEHVVYKHFPPHIPLESCQQGLKVAFEHMFTNCSKSGFNCKYCKRNIVKKESFKAHVVYTHGEQIALEAQKCVGLLPDHLMGDTSDCLKTRNQYYTKNFSTSEEPCEFGQSSTLEQMDFEIEERSVVKMEITPSESLEVDPLDENH